MNNLGRNSVLEFAGVMQKKLDENSHKGGWEGCDNSYLFKRLNQEIKEMKTAIKKNKNRHMVIRECADIANFAMMIADNYEQQ